MRLATGLLAGLGLLAVAACGGDASAPAPTVAAPPPPAVAATFVADAVRVDEGQGVDIELQYRISTLSAPLSLAVSPLDRGAVPEDYELSPATFDIPAGQGVTGQVSIRFTALEDTRISEGDEIVELSLVPPAGVRTELDGNLEVTIVDAGVSPCPGVRMVATPVAPVESSGEYWGTTLELTRETGADAVWLDWEGPYYHGEYCSGDDCEAAWAKRVPLVEVNLVEWRMDFSPRGTSDSLDVEWREPNTLRFGFRSSPGACDSGLAVACTGASCELDR